MKMHFNHISILFPGGALGAPPLDSDSGPPACIWLINIDFQVLSYQAKSMRILQLLLENQSKHQVLYTKMYM